MNRAEFEKHLQSKYPHLYADMHGDMRKTCMAWGIDTGPGWYPLIEKLSEQLEAIIVKTPEDPDLPIKADQVKSKYGSLRFYISSETKEMSALIQEAETASETICETCGKPGTLYTDNWWRTHCQTCETTYQAKRKG